MFDFEEANKLGKEAMDTMLKSYSSLAKSMQLLASEASDYSRKTYEDGAATAEKLAGARTLEKAFEIQADYAKTSSETFIARATRMSEIYADLAKEAYRPYEAAASRSAS
jgi:hypothetical protein